MWIKFKHWLIEKLGGYVEQKNIITFPQPLDFTFDDGITYETIVNSCDLVDCIGYGDNADAVAKNVIAGNIARMAQRAGYIKYRVTGDRMYGELRVYVK